MFGYVTINKQEMKFKEYDIYHAYYCGLCQTLKEYYGYRSQLALNNDLTFLALMLSSLYEVDTKEKLSHCILHPLQKNLKYFNECINYAAKMTIVLTYFKCQDDWLDEKNYGKNLYMHSLNRSFKKIKSEYPDKVEHIEEYLKQIHICEQNRLNNLDEISKYSGYIMAEICAYKKDEWYNDLYDFGFFLGKFIYFMDAYDDIEYDIKNNNYNPLINLYNKDDFDKQCHNILEMMIANATNIFEYLPIIKNIEIMRNILYSGVWNKYNLINKKRMEANK